MATVLLTCKFRDGMSGAMQTNQPHPNLDSDMITTTNKTLTSVCGNSLESFEQLWDLAELSPTLAGIFAKLSKTCWFLAGSLNPPELLPNCSRTETELQKSFASPCKSFASFVQVLKKPSKSSQVLSPFRDPCSQHRFEIYAPTMSQHRFEIHARSTASIHTRTWRHHRFDIMLATPGDTHTNTNRHTQIHTQTHTHTHTHTHT